MKAEEGNDSLYLDVRGKHKYDVTRWRRKGKGISTRGNGGSKVTEAWIYWAGSGSGRSASLARVQDTKQVWQEISLEKWIEDNFEGAC